MTESVLCCIILSVGLIISRLIDALIKYNGLKLISKFVNINFSKGRGLYNSIQESVEENIGENTNDTGDISYEEKLMNSLSKAKELNFENPAVYKSITREKTASESIDGVTTELKNMRGRNE